MYDLFYYLTTKQDSAVYLLWIVVIVLFKYLFTIKVGAIKLP